jgi:SpoIID/LytB domain protein
MKSICLRTRRTLALALITLSAAAGLTAAAATAASAAAEFHFYGGGWGHGVGMSQYGAYGMAVAGSSYTQILGRYYAGTTEQTIATPANIRVGLVQWQTDVRLQAIGGSISLRLNGPTGAVVASIPSGQTWTIQFRGDGRYWVRRASGTFVGGHGWGSTAHNLYAFYAKAGTIVKVLDTGHRYDLGQFEFNIYRPCGTCAYRGRLIEVVGTNGYVLGIAEVPSSWPDAALKAQAVAARTYAVYKANTSGQHRTGCNCAVYANTSDQVYIGYDKVAGADGDRWRAAADGTAWQVIAYNGTPIAAFYSSSSGGHTESNNAEWGGTQLPYLQERCDPGDYTSANPNRTWTVDMNGVGVGNKITSYTGTDIGNATSITVNSRWDSGRIRSVTVHGTAASVTLSGPQFRGALALKSSLVWINENLTVTGDIRAFYDSLDCSPGQPIGPATSPPGGRRQNFHNGTIYIDQVDQHSVFFKNGEILDKFVALGGLNSFLGWPVTGVVDQPWGTRATFAGGTIYNSPETDPHETHGIVQDAYQGAGGAAGSLGLPTTDVQSSGDERSQQYQHGSITCSASSGHCSVQD